MKKLIVSVVLACMAAVSWAAASFSYTGRLRSSDGGTLEQKTANIVFRLYSSVGSATSAALWGREVSIVLDKDGYFSVELSDTAGSAVKDLASSDSLDAVIAGNGTLYIGLEVVGSSGEISPRQKLLSTPRAVFAEDVKNASHDFTVQGTATFKGSVEVTGAASFKEAPTFQNGATFGRSATFEAGARFEQGATFVQSASFGRGASFDERATFSQGATFNNGEATVNAGMTVNGNATFNGGATLPNGSQLRGEISFPNKATFTGGLSVRGGVYAVMPVGTIVMWYGSPSDIPYGWVICDGNNGTPDLRGRVPVGVNTSDGKMVRTAERTAYAKGDQGGVEQVTLGVHQMPNHRHDVLMSDGQPLLARKSTADVDDDVETLAPDGAGAVVTSGVGGSQAHENMPPYRAVYFIMRVSVAND